MKNESEGETSESGGIMSTTEKEMLDVWARVMGMGLERQRTRHWFRTLARIQSLIGSKGQERDQYLDQYKQETRIQQAR